MLSKISISFSIALVLVLIQSLESAASEKTETDPTLKKCILDGHQLIVTGRWDEAVRHFEKSIKTYPNEPQLVAWLSSCYFRKGKLQLAESLCKQAFDRDGDDAMIVLTYLNILDAENRSPESAKIAVAFLVAHPDNPVITGYKVARMSSASTKSKPMLKPGSSPENVIPAVNRLLLAGKIAEAQALIEKHAYMADHTLASAINAFTIAPQKSNFTKARKYLTALKKRSPSAFITIESERLLLIRYAIYLRMQGKLQEALICSRQLYNSNKNDKEARIGLLANWQALIDELYTKGDKTASRKQAEALAAEFPEEADKLLLVSKKETREEIPYRKLLFQGKYREAISELTTLIDKSKTGGYTLHLMRARAYLKLEQKQEALKDLNLAARIPGAKFEPALYELRGKIFLDGHDFGKALEDFDHLIREQPEVARYYLDRAQAFDGLNRGANAAADRKKARELINLLP